MSPETLMPLTLDEALVIVNRESFVVGPPFRAEVTVDCNNTITLALYAPNSSTPGTLMIDEGTWANGHLAWFTQATRKMWLDMYYGASGAGAQTASR